MTACSAATAGSPSALTRSRNTAQTNQTAPRRSGQTPSVGNSAGATTSLDDPSSTSAPMTSSSDTAPSGPSTSDLTVPTTTSVAPKPVHVYTFEGDGETYGVGMAVMALFSVAPTDAAAFEQAATVTVDGEPADGAWYWQQPTVPGYAMEALYREQDYWPAHSDIHVDLPVKGLSAGPGLVYDDNLTLDYHIGAAHISHVKNADHVMIVTSDGKVVNTFPVSLGAADTPTYNGVKVVMAKHNPEEMTSAPGDPHPYDIMVPWSVRITNSGEFIHSASWNTGNIGSRNTSHGCTNLDVDDAKWFYKFSMLGDVVQYPDANPNGTVQPPWDGWGWWNVSWQSWTNGGMVAAL